MMKLRHLTPLLFVLAAPTWADIYKHVDEHGNITFTNAPVRGAQRILIEPTRATARPAAPSLSAPAPSRSTVSPSSFPRVDAGTQKERDISRRRILEDELSNEQRLLNERKQELTNAEAQRSAQEKSNPQQYVERLGRLREGILLHEKNIAALQSELGKLR